MGIIQVRKRQVELLVKEVKDHPMCFQFFDNGQDYTIIYPPGEFPVHGVCCSYGILNSKSEALRRVMNTMEQHWMESYPSTKVV